MLKAGLNDDDFDNVFAVAFSCKCMLLNHKTVLFDTGFSKFNNFSIVHFFHAAFLDHSISTNLQ